MWMKVKEAHTRICHFSTKFIIWTQVNWGRYSETHVHWTNVYWRPLPVSNLRTDKNDANSWVLVRFDFRPVPVLRVLLPASYIFLIMIPGLYTLVLFYIYLLPCWVACGILLPQATILPTLSAVEAQNLKHWTVRKSTVPFYIWKHDGIKRWSRWSHD